MSKKIYLTCFSYIDICYKMSKYKLIFKSNVYGIYQFQSNFYCFFVKFQTKLVEKNLKFKVFCFDIL